MRLCGRGFCQGDFLSCPVDFNSAAQLRGGAPKYLSYYSPKGLNKLRFLMGAGRHGRVLEGSHEAPATPYFPFTIFNRWDLHEVTVTQASPSTRVPVHLVLFLFPRKTRLSGRRCREDHRRHRPPHHPQWKKTTHPVLLERTPIRDPNFRKRP